MNRRIETVAAIKNIRVRHVLQISLAETGWIHARAVGVPGGSALLQLRIRTIGFRWRVQERAEDAEVSKLPGVRRPLGFVVGRELPNESIDGMSALLVARLAVPG
jgi:hypothetical protein